MTGSGGAAAAIGGAIGMTAAGTMGAAAGKGGNAASSLRTLISISRRLLRSSNDCISAA